MKKFLTMLLALAIVFAMAIPTFAADPVNHAKDAKWVKADGDGMGLTDLTEANGVATATGITYEWSSPIVDVLPALKSVLGNKDEVELTISFEVRAKYKAGSEGTVGSARLLFRGVNGLPDLATSKDADAWNEAYYEALDGETPFFNNDGGNILQYAGTMAELTESWTLVTTTIYLYGPQINNECVTGWNLCFDKISVYKDLESLEFRNLSVTDAAEAPVDPTEAPADPTPTVAPADPTEAPADPTPTVAPADPTATTEATATATAKPQATATEAPANDDKSGSPAILIAAIVAAVIIAGCVVAVIVIKKKKSK